ncbi:MAG TPA: Crp/Fnr family transcriptional regulator [candidate division WOR-3 bacterium]|uniref:Crp/Fnr family transcriptional regulator n=1 Tax=candidate division WOR-3 bacterium TaxID=2052148 RepID=A0A9C9EPV4_UNCW3|nr:Crp/Fnr family transcriptional regulator [candidate division WOR-3 bacterium]
MVEGMERKLNPGDVLFEEGDKGDVMYLIREGKIKITKGKGEDEKVLAVLKEGDFFGEMAIIDGSPRSASAIATTPVSLLVIDKETFKSKIKENPLIEYVLETLSRRLRTTDEQIRLLTIKSEERRVVAYIITKAKEIGKKTDQGIEISPFSYENLAHITGIEEGKIKNYVENLEKANLITLKDNAVIIKGIEDLDDYLRYIALKEKFEKP